MTRKEVFEIPFSKMMSNPDYANLSFYSFIIAKMNVQVTDKVPTAGVAWANKKYNLYINPEFFGTMDDNEKIGILIHESLHVMLKHHFRQGERDQRLFNIAADIALNQLINKPAKLPEGAMFPDTFKTPDGNPYPENLTAEGYYELLKEEKDRQEKEKEKYESENGEGEDQDQDEGQCENQSEDQGEGQGEGQPKPWTNGNPDLTGSGEMTIDDHSGWGDGMPEDEEELARSIMERAIKDAIEKSRGNVPGNIEELLDIWSRKAKISWKKVLKRILSSKKGAKINTIKRRDRRQPYRKDLKGKKTFYDTPTVVVGVDTSGSMSNEEIFKGLTEIKEVCKVTHSDLKVIQIDTEIKEVENFSEKTKKFDRKGFGGTYMGECPKYIQENKIECDVLVMISDMYIEEITTDENWRNFKKPVIWLTTSGEKPETLKHHQTFDISDA